MTVYGINSQSPPTIRTATAPLFVFAALLLARILSIVSPYFFEEDEASLAVGIAALVNDTPGGLYRYSVQLGYYRLFEFLDVVLGSRIELIPVLMKGFSAAAGALLPVLGLYAFRTELTVRERWLAVVVLAINPVIWRTSEYGNTAMIATTLATIAVVLLSNRPRPNICCAALACFGAAVLVRADSVLIAPLILLLLYRTSGSWHVAVTWMAALGVTLLAVYGVAFGFDPRMDSAAGAVATHMGINRPTMFWEFLLWAMSPLPFVFALWGVWVMLDTRPRMLGLLVLWGLPTALFYFRATTTARYFMNVVVPLSFAGAVGMSALIDRLKETVRPRIAWIATIGLASVHLFIALGRVPADRPLEFLYGGTFPTDDGPMQTGALLVRTYLAPGSLLRSLPRPTFGDRSYPFWEGPAFNSALARLADPSGPKRTTVIILGGGYGHAFHYHTHAAGVRFVSGPTSGQLLWEGEVWMEIGNQRVMTIAGWADAYAALSRFPVAAGDEVWALSPRGAFPDDVAVAKMPPGLHLESTPSFHENFHTFTVISR
jgi:hypothetical protein